MFQPYIMYLRMTTRVQPSIQDDSGSFPEELREDSTNHKRRFESEQSQNTRHLELGMQLVSRSTSNDFLVCAPVNDLLVQ
jgi:hypothetical protein